MAPDKQVKLVGAGGKSGYVTFQSVLEFTTKLGTAARVSGQFSAFVDPEALDMNVLGRDVLTNFDLIVSRRRNQILLLAGIHRYEIAESAANS